MARLILTAENFAFGPIGKLLTIADLLKKNGHELIFAGFGTSLQLAKQFPFNEIYEIDTDIPDSKNKLSKIINTSDMLVSSMDVQSVKVANELKKKVVYIDCLFWFWEEISDSLFDIDLYVREMSIKDNKNSENEKKYTPKIKNLYTVGPIIPEIEKVNRRKQAIISYGGGEAFHWYKVGKDTNYPSLMTNILNTYVDWSDFDRIIVATGTHILEKLAKEYKNSRFEFTNCGSHEGFLKEMAKSEILLTTAGLVTTQEAFSSETPLAYLPPSNNSHYILQDELKERIPDLPSVHLSDYMEWINLRDKPEEETIPAVMAQLKKVEKSPKIQKAIGEDINRLVANRKGWSEKSVKHNSEFLATLGENGASTVVTQINQLLKD